MQAPKLNPAQGREVERLLPYIDTIVRRFVRRGEWYELDDFRSVARVAACIAVGKYDTAFNTPVDQWVGRCVRQALIKHRRYVDLRRCAKLNQNSTEAGETPSLSLHECIAALPEASRDLAHRRFVERESLESLRESLGVSARQLSHRLKQVTRQLRRVIEDRPEFQGVPDAPESRTEAAG